MTKEKILKFEERFSDYLNDNWYNRTPLEKERILSEIIDQIHEEAYENGWSDCRKKRKEVDEKFIREETEKQIISDYSKNLRCLRCGILKDNKLIDFCPKCLEEA